jgi:hypothetical protein
MPIALTEPQLAQVGPGDSWEARCTGHCQTVWSRSRDSAADQPPFRPRSRRRRLATMRSRSPQDVHVHRGRPFSLDLEQLHNLCDYNRLDCLPGANGTTGAQCLFTAVSHWVARLIGTEAQDHDQRGEDSERDDS